MDGSALGPLRRDSQRLVKSPKVYARDSGLAHALLGITTLEDLVSHPVAGLSWEGLIIEALIAAAPRGTNAHFYRSAAGAEIDLLLTLPDNRQWAIETKRSLVRRRSRRAFIWRVPISSHTGLASSILAKSGSR